MTRPETVMPSLFETGNENQGEKPFEVGPLAEDHINHSKNLRLFLAKHSHASGNVSSQCMHVCSVESNSLGPYRQYSSPGSSVHGILQARILGWVAMPLPRDLPDPGIELAFLSSASYTGRRVHWHHPGSPRGQEPRLSHSHVPSVW